MLMQTAIVVVSDVINHVVLGVSKRSAPSTQVPLVRFVSDTFPA